MLAARALCRRRFASFLRGYEKAAAERTLGIAALPLSAQQTSEVVQQLSRAEVEDGQQLLSLLTHRVPPGVDEAAHCLPMPDATDCRKELGIAPQRLAAVP